MVERCRHDDQYVRALLSCSSQLSSAQTRLREIVIRRGVCEDGTVCAMGDIGTNALNFWFWLK